jgi:hypothetical protein
MLRTEREYLLGDWTPWKIAIALLVPLTFAGLALALWRRSIGWRLVVVNGAVVFKIAWTFWFVKLEGATAHALPAGLGLAVVDVAVVGAARRLRRRRGDTATPSPAPVRP